eukprot:m.76628 g.76628  ORF g.76628 m.76628 type:complete len:259 (+) comp16186_c1_seq1:187-963(+)
MDRDNRILVDRIHETMTRPATGAFGKPDASHHFRSKAGCRLREMSRIMHENQAILKRLEATESTLQKLLWEKDFQRSRAYKKLLSRHSKSVPSRGFGNTAVGRKQSRRAQSRQHERGLVETTPMEALGPGNTEEPETKGKDNGAELCVRTSAFDHGDNALSTVWNQQPDTEARSEQSTATRRVSHVSEHVDTDARCEQITDDTVDVPKRSKSADADACETAADTIDNLTAVDPPREAQQMLCEGAMTPRIEGAQPADT